MNILDKIYIVFSGIVYRCSQSMRLSITQWNLLSRVCFRIYSSGADVSSRPEPVFENNNTLILQFPDNSTFERFFRASLQYQAGNTAYFVTSVSMGTEIVSHVTFNSTPVVDSLPAWF